MSTPNEGINGTLGAGLVGHWGFDNGSLLDESVNGRNLTMTGAVASIADKDGIQNNAMDFDGASKLLTPISYNILEPSISVWFKTSINSRTYRMLTGIRGMDYHFEGFGIYLDDNSNLILVLDTSIDSVINPCDGEWHNAIAIYNKTQGYLKLYLDKILIATATKTNAVLYTITNYIGIGATPSNGFPDYYTGNIDEVRIYGRPLTDGDITTVGQMATGEVAELYDMGVNYVGLSDCATPVAIPSGGTYTKQMQVALSCSTPGSHIYYTKDGSTPTTGSDEYSYAFYLYGSCTVKAIAVASGYNNSSVMSEVYTLILTSPTPNIYPPSGEYSDPFDVQLSAAFYQTIYYTIDGTDPTRDSLDLNTYGYPHITESTTVKARSSVGTGWNLSEVATAEYVFVSKSVPPTITPISGTYNNNIVAVIQPADAGSDIVYYTKDGTEPTYESQQATGESTEIIITETTTIKAFSDKPGFSKSETVTREYIITSEVTIYFDPRNGDAIFDEVVTYDASNYEVASLLPKPVDPIYAGHVFLGWFYSDPYGYSGDDVEWDFNTRGITEWDDGLTLFAKWYERIIVTFDSAGGSYIAPIEVQSGDLVPEPTAPTRAGYKFMGWKRKLDLLNCFLGFTSEQIPDIGPEYYEDIIFYIFSQDDSSRDANALIADGDLYEIVVQQYIREPYGFTTFDLWESYADSLNNNLSDQYLLDEGYTMTREVIYSIEDIANVVVYPIDYASGSTSYGHWCPYRVFIREKANHLNTNIIAYNQLVRLIF